MRAFCFMTSISFVSLLLTHLYAGAKDEQRYFFFNGSFVEALLANAWLKLREHGDATSTKHWKRKGSGCGRQRTTAKNK